MTADQPQIAIEPCTAPDQAGWLDMRYALWPDGTRDELAADLPAMLAEPGRYAQFVAYSYSTASAAPLAAGAAPGRAPGATQRVTQHATQRRPVGFIEASVRSDYVNGTTTSPVAFVEGLYVEPGSRRRGVARALLNAVYAWARELGLREVASDVLLDNVVSQAAHRALGFEETCRVVYFRRDLW